MGRQFLREITAITLTGLALACQPSVLAQAPTAVSHLDDDQMKGVWYEIAHLPDKREKTCIGDAFQLDARGDKPNTLEWVDSCKTKSAYVNVHNSTAKPQNKKTPTDGHLKIGAFWPFTAKYWVIALGPDYGWYLLGSPNHKNLWIYSKSPTLTPDVLAQIESQAAAAGYPVAKLLLTVQSGQSPTAAPALMAP
jgi:apolipoprotein D and lipocalin family protein